jgi:hypothetical protein
MADEVKRDCEENADLLATELDVTNGEFLLFEVVLVKGPKAAFSVADQHGTIILSTQDDPADNGATWRRKLPAKKNELKVPDDLNYSLVLNFARAVRYKYTVTRFDSTRKVIATCKQCSFERASQDDHWVEPLRVFTF